MRGTRIEKIGSNSRYSNYKELVHMTCLTNPNSQPSLDISPIWIPLISNEVSNSPRQTLIHVSREFRFYSTDGASGRHYMSSQIFPFCFYALVFMHLVLLARFVA
jgi:hypothetical protein